MPTVRLEERVAIARRLIAQGDYSPGAGEALDILEGAMREMFLRNLGVLPGDARRRIAECETKIGSGRTVEDFTLGELARLFRESKFLRAWSEATMQGLRGVRVIDFDELARLRNDMRHEGHRATRLEAEMILAG